MRTFSTTKKITFPLLIVTALSIGFRAASEPPPAPTPDNPYIELYRLRVTVAELNSKRQQALRELARARFDRVSRLLTQKAVSQEEYDTSLSDLKVTQADAELAEKKILEAQSYLKIVEAVAKSGQKIPICTSEME